MQHCVRQRNQVLHAQFKLHSGKIVFENHRFILTCLGHKDRVFAACKSFGANCRQICRSSAQHQKFSLHLARTHSGGANNKQEEHRASDAPRSIEAVRKSAIITACSGMVFTHWRMMTGSLIDWFTFWKAFFKVEQYPQQGSWH